MSLFRSSALVALLLAFLHCAHAPEGPTDPHTHGHSKPLAVTCRERCETGEACFGAAPDACAEECFHGTTHDSWCPR